MAAILEIIKRYVFEIICGAVAGVGIVLILLGLGAMGSVTEEMQSAYGLKNEIGRMALDGKPVNAAVIKLEEQRIADIKHDYSSVMDFVSEHNRYEPLLADAFPNPNAATKQAFQRAYQESMRHWLDTMDAGDVPTTGEIQNERDRIQAKLEEEQGYGDEEEDRGRGRDKLLEEAQVSASIKKARSIRVYATPDSFQQSEISGPDGPMYSSLPPSTEEMWKAQLEVWLQQNVVEAITRVNQAAADQLDNEDPWVGVLPIKDIVSIQSSTYYITDSGTSSDSSGGRRGEDKDRAFPRGSASKVFTQNKSTALYEVMQFSVKMVVDSRDLPEIIAGLCEGNFNTPLNVTYEQTPLNLSMKGKIYGDEPTVTVTIDFETVFMSDLYLPIMPDSILEQLNKKRPKPEESGKT